MTDDDLITGAAAPAAERLVRSTTVLDAIWAAVVALVLIGSSFVPLIDLEGVSLRTADAPLRVYALFIPAVALVVAAVSVVRRSTGVAGVATGLLVPSIALGGSVSGALFLDAASPFTDAGVPLTLAASAVGVVMLVRWFVYRPTPVPGRDPRPTTQLSLGLLVVGVVLVAGVLVSLARDDSPLSASFVVASTFMLLTPLVVLAAGFVRSVHANLCAAAACLAQFVAVVVVRFVESNGDGIGLAESATTLRTGVFGLGALAVASAIAILGAMQPRIDADVPVATATDDESWRWSADDA